MDSETDERSADRSGAGSTKVEGTGSQSTATSTDAREPAVDRLKRTASEAGDAARDVATAKAREARAEVRNAMDSFSDEASVRADSWSTALGERTRGLAHALRSASTELREQGERGVSDMAGSAADQIDRMSGYLEDENPGGMIGDLERIARDNPVAFLGTTFALGLLGGRFLRSSSPETDDSPGRGASTTPPTGGSGYRTDSGTYVAGSPSLRRSPEAEGNHG